MIYLVRSEEIPYGGFVVGLARHSKPNKEGEAFIEGIETIYEGHGDGADIFGAMGPLVSIARTDTDVYFFYNENDDAEMFGISELSRYFPDDGGDENWWKDG